MSVAPGRSDSPPHVYQVPNNKFARIDNNPNVRNAEYFAPYVHGGQSQKTNQFYKSPLTSVEIYRKQQSRAMPVDKGLSHIVEQHAPNEGICHGCDWKQILGWTLISLALLGLAIGLFFLVKHLLTKSNDQPREYTVPDVPLPPTYTGVNPVYVNPVPFSSMQAISEYLASASQQKFNYVTSPTSLRKQETTVASAPAFNGVTQPSITWTSDEASTNFVRPLDVYPSSQK